MSKVWCVAFSSMRSRSSSSSNSQGGYYLPNGGGYVDADGVYHECPSNMCRILCIL